MSGGRVQDEPKGIANYTKRKVQNCLKSAHVTIRNGHLFDIFVRQICLVSQPSAVTIRYLSLDRHASRTVNSTVCRAAFVSAASQEEIRQVWYRSSNSSKNLTLYSFDDIKNDWANYKNLRGWELQGVVYDVHGDDTPVSRKFTLLTCNNNETSFKYLVP